MDREKRVPKPGSSIWRVSTAGASVVELVEGADLCDQENERVKIAAPKRDFGFRAFHYVLGDLQSQ